MSTNLQELNPRKSEIVINKKTYVLKKFSLLARVWARTEFATPEQSDGLMVLAKRMETFNDIEAWSKMLYHLLEDRRDFKNYESFLGALEKGGKFSNVIQAYRALMECIGLSEPEPESEDTKDLKKSVAVVA